MSENLNQELRQLLDAVAQRAEPWLRKIAVEDPLAGSGKDTASGAAASHRASCTWCPLCAAISLARGERPELAAKAAEHLSGLLSVLRASMEPEQPKPEPAPEPEPRPEPAPRVQKISVDRC
ncbi:hypothetical protein [Allokutzneria albata]|uniref:Uncharacterized protein n=1 Tax=Allokutzneria albata TaxID=211114 RepID=A0A1H0CR21_ALLAB|nr:hypothetical protein [Allokutzneria albata]SDN60286.1 hypothetical protein SAMN04489726_7371 [Allokutzneria albata]